MITTKKELDALLAGQLGQPHALLGMHPHTQDGRRGLLVRALVQDAVDCEVVDHAPDPELRYPMGKHHALGFFEAFIADRQEVFPYRLRITKTNGEIRQFYDPYRFLPTLGEQDVYFFNEGTDHRVYQKLGAHVRTIDGVLGVSFAVWAPNAARVSVVGDFNRWDGRFHPMRSLGNSGVWELFVPGLQEGALYKYEIVPRRGAMRLKTDPYGSYFESPPNNASVVWNVRKYQWGDQQWMARRDNTDWRREPVLVYEMHLGSWKRNPEDGNRPFTYREMASELVPYLQEMGYTHVEFMPLAEYPFDGSWGYQVTGFYAPTHRYGTPEDFMFLVDTLHQNNIGVILDWVPAHFPKDFFALAHFDGTHLYEHADPRQGEHQDWGTLIFNYSRPEVRCFLLGSAMTWLDRYHIDGLRVDAVASMLYLDYSRKPGQWIPNKYGGRENLEAISFLRYANDTVHKYFPGVLMIAEESTAWGGVSKPAKEGGLGFDLKWNMGWMHDTLEYFKKDPIHRKFHHNQLTFGMLYQNTEHFMMTFSHDEVVHGKGSLLLKMGAYHIPDKARQLRALYAWMWGWPGKKTLFMGGEFGQSAEWAYDRSLDWHLTEYIDHEGIRLLVADLNRFYREHAFIPQSDFDPKSFQWVNPNDGNNSVISFVRFGTHPDEVLLVAANLTPVPRDVYRVGVPRDGLWREVLNTNAQKYGGDGAGNPSGAQAQPIPWDGRPFAVDLHLPGMSVMFFVPEKSETPKPEAAKPKQVVKKP
ncbi:MAG: 1,4-alpha-glucan branching protein GlgB [Verrucomicrobia bacterium]|jgi:1,4-alpha-glucan branching enzyme|nr:1,4-alpha-glucan branching protein GlgB [Verrucomicrobiota bacterium]